MGQRHRTGEPTTFVLSGTVAGVKRQTTTDSPARSATQLAIWLQEDAKAELSWTVSAEWPEWVLLTARLRPAPRVGESLRVAHLFVLDPGQQIGPQLTSQCGTAFAWWSLEFGDNLDDLFGAPCVACELTVEGNAQQSPPVEPSSTNPGHWKGWDEYYRELGWPVVEYDGALMLTADSDLDDDVTVLSVPAALGEQVQRRLAHNDRMAPMWHLPGNTEEVLFIASRTNLPVEFPSGVHRVPVGIPLPPSPTAAGQVAWTTSPGTARPGYCRDLDVLASVNHLHRLSAAAQRKLTE